MRRLALNAMAFLLLLVTSVGLSAQAVPIQAGQTLRGELAPGDAVRSDDSYQDTYILQATAGDRLQIDLQSDDFDAYLLIGRTVGGEFDVIESNDDGGSGLDSRIVITLEEGGLYQILANSLSGGATGAYTLSVQEAMAEVEPELRRISPGEALRGRLSSGDATLADGSYYDLYRFQGSAGMIVQADMESSAFDTYMALGSGSSAGTFTLLETNDDGGSGTDSRITYTVPSSGTYLIRANSLSAAQTGDYTVRLRTLSNGSRSNGGGDFPQIYVFETRVGELSGGDRQLADGSYYDGYLYRGSAGDRITITMRSDDFDAYLSFGRFANASFESLESSDDDAGGTDSRITYTLPSSGLYLIRANSLLEGSTGRYTLTVED